METFSCSVLCLPGAAVIVVVSAAATAAAVSVVRHVRCEVSNEVMKCAENETVGYGKAVG